MATDNILPGIEEMRAVVDPWHQSLNNPSKAQETVLEQLLKGYSQTEYGREHKSENVGSYADYTKAFPIQTFTDFRPFIDKVKAGNTEALLYEEPVVWGLTKGTTGENKFFPFTHTHIKNYAVGVNRVLFSYALSTQNSGWLTGYRVSINSSGNLGTIKVGGKEMSYGYSFPAAMSFLDKMKGHLQRATPTQDEINTIPGESTKLVWEARHEFVYQKSRDLNVTYTISAPVALLGFGRYLYRKHNIFPKDLWQIELFISSGFPGVHSRFSRSIRALYGKSISIRDLYAATEGMFGGQTDNKKALCPFYDIYFFEVKTISGIKQLHEMHPGEIGSLIVSTPVLPRYRIGDLILAFEPPYFRCIGRENTRLHPYSFGKLTGKSGFNLTKSKDLNSWR